MLASKSANFRRRRDDRLTSGAFFVKGSSIPNVKYWLPQAFARLTMGLAIAIVLFWVLGGIHLIYPYLHNTFEIWARTVVIVVCLMAITAIQEATS
jgi:hypothetical protein